MSGYSEAKSAALAKLDAGDGPGAYQAFLPVLGFPGDEADAQFADAMDVFARIVLVIMDPEFASIVQVLAEEPDDGQALYDTAYRLYEEGQYSIAATLLARENRIRPGQEGIVTELSANLEELQRNAEAAHFLRSSGFVGRDPMVTYLTAFNLLMSGELNETMKVVEQFSNFNAAEFPDFEGFAQPIHAMIARAHAVAGATPLDVEDLTGWHLAINGTLLLHESPLGFHESMRGRYAMVADSYGLMREGIETIQKLLPALGHQPAVVMSAPDRSSRILGRAAAGMLGRPWQEWDPTLSGPRLVVAYDLDGVGDGDVLKLLQAHHPGQLLWAHAGSWTNPFPYTPDLQTFQYQVNDCPWAGGGMRVDPKTQSITQSEPDTASEEEVAGRITGAEISDPSHRALNDLQSMVTATKSLGAHAPGFAQSEGNRSRQRNGTPVKSSRFT